MPDANAPLWPLLVLLGAAALCTLVGWCRCMYRGATRREQMPSDYYAYSGD